MTDSILEKEALEYAEKKLKTNFYNELSYRFCAFYQRMSNNKRKALVAKLSEVENLALAKCVSEYENMIENSFKGVTDYEEHNEDCLNDTDRANLMKVLIEKGVLAEDSTIISFMHSTVDNYENILQRYKSDYFKELAKELMEKGSSKKRGSR